MQDIRTITELEEAKEYLRQWVDCPESWRDVCEKTVLDALSSPLPSSVENGEPLCQYKSCPLKLEDSPECQYPDGSCAIRGNATPSPSSVEMVRQIRELVNVPIFDAQGYPRGLEPKEKLTEPDASELIDKAKDSPPIPDLRDELIEKMGEALKLVLYWFGEYEQAIAIIETNNALATWQKYKDEK